MSELWDVIVLGGGPAGYTAGLYAARAGFSVLLMEKLSPGGQMATTDRIENYPGFPEGIEGWDLADRMKKSAERFGVKTKLSEVVSVNLAGDVKEIRTKRETFNAKTVVLATGAHPKELGLPFERELRGRGVSYCATCDGMFYRGKEVCVIGGGNTAVSDALYLSRICSKVWLIHRRDKLRASKVYEEALRTAGNIEILWNSQAEALLFGDAVSGVRVKTGDETREIPLSGVFIAVGTEPETSLYNGQVDMDAAGYILADESTRTNLPGVFAAGDLRKKPLRQVVTAASDGAVAAHFIEEYLAL